MKQTLIRQADPWSHRVKTRLLFIHNADLGWGTLARHLEHFTAADSSVESQHHRTRTSLWLKMVTQQIPILGRSITSHSNYWAQRLQRQHGEALLEGKFDAVFTAGQGLAAALMPICKKRNIPLVVSLDTTGPSFVRDLEANAARAEQPWPQEQELYDYAALLLPMSRWAADSLQNDFEVPGSKILICPPSVAVPFEKPDHKTTLLPRILFLGNDWERKGGPKLLQWHQQLWSDRSELHIVSAGAPVDRAARNVTFHGRVPHDVLMRELLPSCHLFCMPTRHDMSPFALAEAQAAGLPCVTSRLAGLPDLVIDQQTGILAGPQDDQGFQTAISRLLDDQSLRMQMSVNAHQHALRNLSSDKNYPMILQRIRELSIAPSIQ